MYQPRQSTTGRDHHLPPLPALIILATDQDNHLISNSQTWTYHHDHQEYELANYCTLPQPPNLMHHTSRPDLNYQLPAAAVNNVMSNNDHGDHRRLLDSIDYSCSLRRVFGTGDLQLQILQMEHQQRQYQLSRQQQQGQSSSKEISSTSSSIIEGMLNKPCRYSPEEKRERIERYKTKRSHRNFNKKIKYACRKTLADSRPRIRGRFARNDNSSSNNEDEKWTGNKYCEADHDNCAENNEDDNCWIDLFNAAWLHK